MAAAMAVLASAEPASGSPRFRLDVAPVQPTIGDRVELTLRCRDPQFDPARITHVHFHRIPEQAWALDQPWQRNWSEGAHAPWRAVLRPFQVGRLDPPEAIVRFSTDGATSETLATGGALQVQSVRSGDSNQGAVLYDMRPRVEIPRQWTGLAGLLAIAAAGLAGAFLIARRIGRRRNAGPDHTSEPELSPGLWALRELDRRRRLPVCSAGPAKAIYTHVSEVLRLYLDRRYGIRAIDMTTLECLRALCARRVDPEHLRWIKDFLDECDRVKFTPSLPSRERWSTIWHDARLIVKVTTPADEMAGGPEAVEPPERREQAS